MFRIIFISFLIFSPFTWAHHGWSGYKAELLKLDGTIEQSKYQNPHGTLRLKTGSKVLNVVLAPTSRMSARGLSEEMLAVGTKVRIEGYEKTADSAEVRAERITVAGKTVELR